MCDPALGSADDNGVTGRPTPRHVRATVRHLAGRLGAVSSGRALRSYGKRRLAARPLRAPSPDLAERRRSRTDRAWGYHTAQVLKTCWATGPMPLRA